MKKETTRYPEIKLIGLSARTNNKNEMNPQTAKIGALLGRYCSQENYAEKIPSRKNAGVTFAVYTDYESDFNGDYTYFVGEEVLSLENIPAGFQSLIIPAATYQKFTTPWGKMPEVVIQAWQQIWQMSSDTLGGDRAYQADFEVYDERAHDPLKTSLDIYIGTR